MIGGTSHTGKSTLAAALGTAIGWPVISTDRLARHPGRPWPAPKPHVAECYRKLSTDTLVTLLHHHHATMRPILEEQAMAGPVILEGNALRPEFWPDHASHRLLRLLLIGDDAVLFDRMHASAGDSATEHADLIEAFWNRSRTDQTHLARSAANHDWTIRDLCHSEDLEALRDWVIEAVMRPPHCR